MPGKRLMPFAVSRISGKPALLSGGSSGSTGELTRSSANRLDHSKVGFSDQSYVNPTLLTFVKEVNPSLNVPLPARYGVAELLCRKLYRPEIFCRSLNR